MRNFVDEIESISLGFIRNRKEGESKFNAIPPEAATAKKIFTCFGKGEFNQKEILNSFQAWLEKCPVDYDEHLQTSDDDITTINFHYKNIWNRKQKENV